MSSFIIFFVEVSAQTPSTAFRHLPPNSARFGYAIEGALFISIQLSINVVSRSTGLLHGKGYENGKEKSTLLVVVVFQNLLSDKPSLLRKMLFIA